MVELIGGLILGDVDMGIVALLGLGVSENSLGVLGKQGLRDIMTGIRVMKTGELNWNTCIFHQQLCGFRGGPE